MGSVERRPRLSASSISFRDTPELNSTPPAGSGQFAHAARNVPTPPGILSGSPTTSPARGGTVSRARAMARTESHASEERRSTQSQSTLDLVNNMKKLRSASPHACSTQTLGSNIVECVMSRRRAQFEEASAAASSAASPARSSAQPASPARDRHAQGSPKNRQTAVVRSTAAVPRAATGSQSVSHTASSAGDVDGLVRELQELAARGSVELLGQFLAGHPGHEVVNGSPPPHRRTALIIAAAHQRVPQMGVLLKAGADTECTDIHGWTAFHYACSSGCVEAAETLLRAGCNADATEKNGRSGMALAREQGLSDLVSVLEHHSIRRVGAMGGATAVDPVRRSTLGSQPVLQQAESPQRLRQFQQHQHQHQREAVNRQETAPSLTPALRGSTDPERTSTSTLSPSASSTTSSSSATARAELTADEKQQRMALHRELQRERIARKAAEARNVELELELKRANTLITELRQRPASAAAHPGGRAGGGSRGDGQHGGHGSAQLVHNRSNPGADQQQHKRSNGILSLLQDTIRETFERSAATARGMTNGSDSGITINGSTGADRVRSVGTHDSPRDLFKKDNSVAGKLARDAAAAGGSNSGGREELQPEPELPVTPIAANVQHAGELQPEPEVPVTPTAADVEHTGQDENASSAAAPLAPEEGGGVSEPPTENRLRRPTTEDLGVDFNLSSFGEMDLDALETETEEEEDDEEEQAPLSPEQQMAAAKALLSSSGDGNDLEEEVAAARALAAKEGIAVAKVGSASAISPGRLKQQQQRRRAAAVDADGVSSPKQAPANESKIGDTSTPVKLTAAVVTAGAAAVFADGEQGEMSTENHLALMELQSKFQAMDGEAYQTFMDQHGHDPTLQEAQAALHQLIASDPARFLEPPAAADAADDDEPQER